MADATLSSEDEEIENPIETAVSRGASFVEPEKASISRKWKVIVNSGQNKASREHTKQLLLKLNMLSSEYSNNSTKFLSNFLAYFLATF